MRKAGHSWDEIAAELKYAGKGAAYTDFKRALEASQGELSSEVEERRALEDARLDDALAVVTRIMNTRHVVTNGGNIVRDEEGRTLQDDGPLLAAVDRLVKISESRRKLRGDDAPAKQEIVATSTVEYKIAVDADELEEL
jgi:hypothetical protein